MSRLTAGSSTSARKRCASLALSDETKRRVAWKVACGDQAEGSVRYRMSSQLRSEGTTLKALGRRPAV